MCLYHCPLAQKALFSFLNVHRLQLQVSNKVYYRTIRLIQLVCFSMQARQLPLFLWACITILPISFSLHLCLTKFLKFFKITSSICAFWVPLVFSYPSQSFFLCYVFLFTLFFASYTLPTDSISSGSQLPACFDKNIWNNITISSKRSWAPFCEFWVIECTRYALSAMQWSHNCITLKHVCLKPHYKKQKPRFR